MIERAHGLDMRPTIEWYAAHEKELLSHLPPARGGASQYPLLERQYVHLDEGEIRGLLSLYPAEALRRSILRHLVGKPQTWFHRDSAKGTQQSTTDVSEALSPTAIIPSYTDTSEWQRTGTPSCDIWLFGLGDECSAGVKRIVHAEGLIHEVGHSILYPPLYIPAYTLTLPSGKTVDGLSSLRDEFTGLAERYPPVSRYASAFRREDGTFSGETDDDHKRSVSEELCECIAAHLLGFAFSLDEPRRCNPLADRPDVEEFVHSFLHATLQGPAGE